MPRQRYQVLHTMNFESPYVDMPHRLTVRQNLKVFGRLYAVEDLDGRIAALAEELDLTEFLDRPTGKLSAGQKTRVALAKALINSPQVLLLDEPTASLDPDTADWVRSRLERFRQERGATVLLASHNMAEVERLCERVIIMKRGRIEDDDTPERLLTRYGRETLEEVFLDVARGRGEAARGRAMSAACHERGDLGAAPHRRHGAALSLSAALVLDAAARAHLLAGGAAASSGASCSSTSPSIRASSPAPAACSSPPC